MTPQQILGIAFRLAAIWLVLLCFQLYAILEMLARGLHEEKSALTLIGILAPLPLALAFWMFPMLFAHKVLTPRPGAAGGAFALQDCSAALAIIIGMATVIAAIPTLAGVLMMYVLAPDASLNRVYFASREAEILAHLSGFGLGIALILLARPLAERIFPSRATSSL